jgi:alanine dehydrogenase
MSTLLFAVLVTILPWYEEQAAQAAPSRVKVFLAASPEVRVQRDCFAVLATSLTTQIAAAKTIVPARSAADADVVVQVKECRTTSTPKVGGEASVTTWTGGQGRGVQTRTAVEAQAATVARVVLVVDDHGKPKEFSPEVDDLPLPEATQSATASLLAWIKAAHPN